MNTSVGETRPSEPISTVVGIGSQLGPYLLLDKLGEGGMGAVYKARHAKLDKLVALKILPQHVMSRPDALSRFEREMKAVGKLSHPNVVQALDAGDFGGVHYLSMEYVEGQDLQELVKAKGPMSVVNACKAVRQAALGLAAAHKLGLVHRDIKPSNLFVTKETGQIKILDMGLALLSEEQTPAALTSTGQCFGTPDYMAPEQWEDAHTCDARADLYALGCTLFLLLVGRTPYGGDEYRTVPRKMMGHVRDPIPDLIAARAAAVGWTPSSDPSSGLQPSPAVFGGGDKRTDEGVHPTGDIPDGLDAIYRKLMAKNPKDRFASADQLAKALAPFTRSRGDASQNSPSKNVAWTPRPSENHIENTLESDGRGVHPTLAGKAPIEATADTSTWTPDQSPHQAANTKSSEPGGVSPRTLPSNASRSEVRGLTPLGSPDSQARPQVDLFGRPVPPQGEVMPQLLDAPTHQPERTQEDWLGLPVVSSPTIRTRQSAKRSRFGWPMAVAFGAVALVVMWAVYVITVKTPQGELVIHSDTAGITVKIKSGGDEVVKDWKIVKGDDNKQLIRTGKIEIELPAELSGEFSVTPNTVTLTKGKQEIVKIERKKLLPPSAKGSKRHVALLDGDSEITGPALDRRVAEWVLAKCGECMITDLDKGVNRKLKPGDSLPEGPITLYDVQVTKPIKSSELANLAGLQNITRLSLESPSINSSAIPYVAQLKPLIGCAFYRTGIRTSALTGLRELPFLTHVSIDGEQVDDNWAFIGKFDALWNLTVVCSFPPSPQDVEAWAKFPQLHKIFLATTRPVDATILAEFQRQHRGCRIIFVKPGVSQRVLGIDPVRETIIQLLPKGVEFEIFVDADNETRRATQETPNLPPDGQHFWFHRAFIPSGVPLMQDDLLPLANCNFESLHAHGRKQADALLQSLPPRLAVYAYNLSGSDVTDEGLKHLHGISWLKNLDITNTRVTESGVKEFHTKNPHSDIVSDFGRITPNWSAPKPTAK